MKKLIFTSLLFLGVIISGFSQSDKLKAKADEKVDELNTEIIAGDTSQALTDAQKEQIQVIHMERLKELRQAKKDGADQEANKEINKKYFQKIFKEVLTKEQMKARKVGKENQKID